MVLLLHEADPGGGAGRWHFTFIVDINGRFRPGVMITRACRIRYGVSFLGSLRGAVQKAFFLIH